MSYEPYPYWEDRAQTWIDENFQTEKDWEEIKEYFPHTGPVMELGCGTGRFSPYFEKYAGLDISHRLIAHAKLRYPEKRWNQCDIENYRELRFRIKGPYCHTIFTYTALEHIRPEAIQIVADALADRRHLILVEPHKESGVDHCFNHDYEKLFKVKPVKVMDNLTVWRRDGGYGEII